jgi:hypothetical protein
VDSARLIAAISAASSSPDRWEFWLLLATLLVVVGLPIEYFHDLRQLFSEETNPAPPGRLWTRLRIQKKLAMEVLGGVLITVGVAGELFVQFKASKVETDLRNATDQLVAGISEKFRYRSFTEGEQQTLIAALKPYCGETLDILVRSTDDPEVALLFNQVALVAAKAGWKVNTVYILASTHAIVGVEVEVTHDANSRSREAANLFANVLRPWIATNPLREWEPTSLIKWVAPSGALRGNIKVTIGTRPGLL